MFRAAAPLFPAVLALAAATLAGGCVLAPILDDGDTSVVDRNMEEMDARRSERFARNPGVNASERQALEGPAGARDRPPPTVEDLEKRVEADKAEREKRNKAAAE